MPNCTFIGADPIRESGIIYQQLGEYHEVALGATDGKEIVKFQVLFKVSQNFRYFQYVRDDFRQLPVEDCANAEFLNFSPRSHEAI